MSKREGSMTERARIEAMLQRKKPDRVPNWPFSFGGVDDHVNVLDSPSLDTGTQFTIDAWFKTDDVNKIDPWTERAQQAIVMYGFDDIDGRNNPLQIRDGVLFFSVRGLASPQFDDLTGVTPIANDTWYLATVTYDGTTAKMYLNGNPEDSKNVTMNMVSNSRVLIGCYQNPKLGYYRFYFGGLIDEVEIFDRALSQSEIQAIYDAGQLGKCKEITVDIDVKPGSDPNCFNINGHGVIPVAILGSADFDVTDIDTSTLSFAGLDVRVRGNKGPMCHLEDVSGDFATPEGAPDGYFDLVCQFEDDPGNWQAGGDTADLTGVLYDGTPIQGTDSICVVP